MAQDSQHKSLPATEHRLKKGREKGQVASSQDFVADAIAVTVGVWLLARGGALGRLVLGAFRVSVETATLRHSIASDIRAVQGMFSALLFEMGGLVVAAGLAGLVANAIHKGGLVVSTAPLVPDFSRISLGAGFKRMFGMRHMAGLGVALAFLLLWFGLTALVIWGFAGSLLNAPLCGFGCLLDAGRNVFQTLALLGLVAVVVAGLLDLPLQIFFFRRDMRMSHQDRKQETRELEGSPEVEQQRKELHQKLVRLGSGLPTVVLTSADCAVALRYDPRDVPVPVVVLKGRDAARGRILAAAERLGVPIVADPPLARHLMGRIAVGSEIAQGDFGAVAPHIVRSAPARP